MELKAVSEIQLRRAHNHILTMIDANSNVLDVGSGGGALTAALVRDAGCTVTAVDLTADKVAYAGAFAQATVEGSIEDPSTWEQIEGPFDYIVFADVLEHLADPWAVLRRCKDYLTPGGCVVASIPNVAYYRVRQHLLFGRFDYCPFGVLDRTHLRFFTAKTVQALFLDTDYTIQGFERVYTSRKNELLGKLFPNAFTYEYVLKTTCSKP